MSKDNYFPKLSGKDEVTEVVNFKSEDDYLAMAAKLHKLTCAETEKEVSRELFERVCFEVLGADYPLIKVIQ